LAVVVVAHQHCVLGVAMGGFGWRRGSPQRATVQLHTRRPSDAGVFSLHSARRRGAWWGWAMVAMNRMERFLLARGNTEPLPQSSSTTLE